MEDILNIYLHRRKITFCKSHVQGDHIPRVTL